MLPLFLLPLLTCPIYYLTARHYAREAEEKALRTVQTGVLQILAVCREETDTEKSVRRFFGRTDAYMAHSAGDTGLLVFSRDLRILYPRGRELYTALQPLADGVAASIRSGKTEDSALITASDDTPYRIAVAAADTGSDQIGYIVTYAHAAETAAWVKTATWVVLIVSALSSLLSFLLSDLAIRGICRPLHLLEQEAARIGGGDYSPIERSFSLQELEDLRLSMNAMAAQLRHAEKTQKDFFAGITHDLRSPLVSIGGYAQGIACGVFSPPGEAAQRIMDESKRMTELLDRMAELTQLESYLVDVRNSSFRVTEETEECLERFEHDAAERGVALRLQADGTALRAQGNSELFHAALDNLLSNALRYAKTEIEVALRAEGGQVLVTVADDGDGIREEDLPRVFQRFFKGPGGQHGLGLAIAWHAAAHMGGSLTAANRPEGGAIFTLSLPQKEQ
ncbi:MAG: HAMP domain-containing sensor histidine kinase [Eubacteriales bacterium]|nr:HAMP domain-containing sensor histidine kinase [Eubacteriales bacterium]